MEKGKTMTDSQINNRVWGESPMMVRRYKTYKRNGKTFIRDYKRTVKGGMNVLDIQRWLNKIMTEALHG